MPALCMAFLSICGNTWGQSTITQSICHVATHLLQQKASEKEKQRGQSYHFDRYFQACVDRFGSVDAGKGAFTQQGENLEVLQIKGR